MRYEKSKSVPRIRYASMPGQSVVLRLVGRIGRGASYVLVLE